MKRFRFVTLVAALTVVAGTVGAGTVGAGAQGDYPNKPGGGGVIGARAALKEARPDGYTVLIDIHTTSSMHIGASKTPALKLEDRKFAGRIVRDPMVFAVKADAPWKNFKEFSDWVKANPGDLIWSTVGPA